MLNRIETFWTFETPRFRIEAIAWEEPDLDLSFDDTGEIRERLDSHDLCAFQVEIAVYCDGKKVANDWLGNCIYESPGAFRNHIGISKPAMAKKAKRDLRDAMTYARGRLEYFDSKVASGAWSKCYRNRNARAVMADLREKRATFQQAMRLVRSPGQVGSYFSDMICEACSMARREILDAKPAPYVRESAT